MKFTEAFKQEVKNNHVQHVFKAVIFTLFFFLYDVKDFRVTVPFCRSCCAWTCTVGMGAYLLQKNLMCQ
jgi:hypothetical protein